MKIGLVLEGGAMRGMYTAGVLDVFLENGIEADKIVGVSAGALFGVNYLSKQNGRTIRYNKRFNRNKNYMGIRPFLKEGNFVNTKFAYEDVPKKLDPFDNDTFKNSKADFYAVVTNVQTGKAEYIKVDDVFGQMDVLRASGSMPIVSKPVLINGKHYLDGGIADSIPFRWLSRQECDKIIVVLTRDASYRKGPAPKFTIWKLKKYPKIAKKMKERHENYNSSLEELKTLEESGNAFVIQPSEPIKIGRLERNPGKLQMVYELGRKDGEEKLKELKQYLK